MKLSLEIVEAAYELIRACPPFKGWNLPPADDVEFHIINANVPLADYVQKPDGVHCIRVNEQWIGSLNVLLRILMHEICHLHHGVCCPGDEAHHGEEFQKRARSVCRIHCLDVKEFSY